jgi:hypothetical protein
VIARVVCIRQDGSWCRSAALVHPVFDVRCYFMLHAVFECYDRCWGVQQNQAQVCMRCWGYSFHCQEPLDIPVNASIRSSLSVHPSFFSSYIGLVPVLHIICISIYRKRLVNTCVWGGESKGGQRLQPIRMLTN